MITKAYIQEVISSYKVRVRIPLYHKIKKANGYVPDDLLPMSIIVTHPNVNIEPNVGDVVIVDFEEDDLGKPVILGYLYSSSKCASTINMNCEDLSANGEISFGKDIQIGDIKYENLECLKNQKDNLSITLMEIRNDISKLSDNLGSTSDKVGTNISAINKLDDYAVSISSSIESLSQRVSDLETALTSIKDSLTEYVNKYPMIVGENTYGTNPGSITNPQEGQVYFTILSEDKK